MSATSENTSGSAEREYVMSTVRIVTSQHCVDGYNVAGGNQKPEADRDADVVVASEELPVRGDRHSVVTGVSGMRSRSEGGSVLAKPAQPGPASSRPGGTTDCRSVLHRFVADVGDVAIVEQFVADYLRLLDQRIATLDRLLSGTDTEATAISLLTLETSSAMVGGRDAVVATRAVRHAVEGQHHGLTDALFGQLRITLHALAEQLVNVELRPRPAPHPVVE